MNPWWHSIMAMGLLFSLSCGAKTPDPPSPPADSQASKISLSELANGEARGTLKAGEKAVELKYANASKTRAFEQDCYELLLGDQALPESALKKAKSLFDAATGNNTGQLLFLIDREGKVLSFSLAVQRPDLTSFSFARGYTGSAMELESVTIGESGIQGKLKDAGERDGTKWSYQVAFRASMIARP